MTRWRNIHYLAQPTEGLKCLKFPPSEFHTVVMCRGMQACKDKFLAMVTEGVVQGVYKVMIWLSFGETP